MEKSKFNLYLLIGLIILSLIIICLLANQNQNITKLIDRYKPLKLGDKAYIFKAYSLDGKPLTIKSETVLLIFFNTSCPTCIANFNELQMSYNKLEAKKIKIIGISSDPEIKTKYYADHNKLVIPIIVDFERQIFNRYKIRYVPTVVLVNSKGKIIFFQQQNQSLKDSINEIEKLIL